MELTNIICIYQKVYDIMRDKAECSNNELILYRQKQSEEKWERVFFHDDFNDHETLIKYLENRGEEYSINSLYLHVLTINNTRQNITISKYIRSLINALDKKADEECKITNNRDRIIVASGGDDAKRTVEAANKETSIIELISKTRADVLLKFQGNSEFSEWQENPNVVIPKKVKCPSSNASRDANYGYPELNKLLLDICILFYPNWLGDDISSIKDSLKEGQSLLDENKDWKNLPDYTDYKTQLEKDKDKYQTEYKAFNAVKKLKEVLISDLTNEEFRKKYEALCKTVCNRES